MGGTPGLARLDLGDPAGCVAAEVLADPTWEGDRLEVVGLRVGVAVVFVFEADRLGVRVDVGAGLGDPGDQVDLVVVVVGRLRGGAVRFHQAREVAGAVVVVGVAPARAQGVGGELVSCVIGVGVGCCAAAGGRLDPASQVAVRIVGRVGGHDQVAGGVEGLDLVNPVELVVDDVAAVPAASVIR